MDRSSLVDVLAEWVGGHLVTVVDRRDGWPGLVQVCLPGGDLLAAVHVGPVGLSHRERDEVERRFQNPGQNRPMSAPGQAIPLLLGIWEDEGRQVLVGMDANARLGKLTRQSLFIPLWLLEKAAATGWAEHHSTSGELIVAFHPALLPTYVELRREGLNLPPEQVTGILRASGLIDLPAETPDERARKATSTLVRNAKFSRDVVGAYDGLCAMCGLNFGLVESAHIYPVQAPRSPDNVWNGLALCGNHHTAFDRHLVWVDPARRSLRVHPDVLADTDRNEASRRFVEMTFDSLKLPRAAEKFPRSEMFQKRYEFFGKSYSWADS